MKLLPIPLPSLGAPPSMGMWGSEMLWRYPPAPPNPYFSDVKTALPPQISNDPRLWGRDDVAIFLRFCEHEFDLPKFDMDLFQMNGKALCLLKRADLAERCPSAGDIVHNIIQMHMRESQMLQRHLPSSPVTPTSRYPLSPHSHPPTPNWSSLAPPENPFHATHLQHFMATNSVALSPAPSIDSQASSPPQHQETVQTHFNQNGTSSSSNQSDSEEESYLDSSKIQTTQTSPPPTPSTKEGPSLSQQITNVGSSWSGQIQDGSVNQRNGSTTCSVNTTVCSNVANTPTTPNAPGPFIPMNGLTDMPEPNTNGRLLWDFLQQLLNDPGQRYSTYIAWKCRDTGVFKIVDPAGLATLWGIQKNHLSMNYDKMSRALRYYYRVNILRKVQGERHCYQFLRNPTELKLIKTLSVLRQKTTTTTASNNSSSSSSVASSALQQQHQKINIKVEPKIEIDNTKPTDLSNNNSNNITIDTRNLNGKNGVPDCFSFLRNATTDLKSIKSLATSSATNHQQSTNINNLHIMSASSGTAQTSMPVISSTVTPHHTKHKPSNLKLVSEDDMPTDLSTGGDRKYLNNSDSYPYIRTPTDLKNMKITSPLPQKPSTPTNCHLSHQLQHDQLQQHLSSTSQPSTPPAHSFVHKQNFAAMSAAVQSAAVNQQHNLQQLKQRMETDEKDEKSETEQQLNGHHTNNDWRFGQDCYPLINNSNGLTTIQLVRNNNEITVDGSNCSSSNR